MKWNEFFKDAAEGRLRQAYLFTGPEEYVKREALEKLRAAILPVGLEALNETVMEDVNADRIIAAAETLPVMSDRRLVVVRDWGPLMSGKSKDEENEANKLIEWLSRPTEECTLVFYMREEADSRKKLTQELNKRGCNVDFDQLTDSEIARWVNSHLKPFKKKMSAEAVQQLVFTAGRELTRLDGEINKLVAYTGDRGVIDEMDIDAVVSPSLEYGAFDMLNHLFDGDTAGAYRLMELMLERGGSRIAIIASIARQLRGMSFMAIAIENGGNVEDTGKQLSLNPYAAKVMAQKARRFPADELEKTYIAAIESDHAIKSGQMREAAALDRLFIKISAIPRKNAQPAGANRRLS